jgi:hypothetical protein
MVITTLLSKDLLPTPALKFAGALAAAIALSAAVDAGSAKAAFVNLNYEGIGSGAAIQNFYNGGTDSTSVNSGTNYGVTFSNAALGLIDLDAGGSGNFANEPSPNTIMYFLDAQPYMNYVAGFTQFSTYYSTDLPGAMLDFYTGPNGTGTKLGSSLSLPFNRPGSPACTGDPNGFPYCNWDLASIVLSGSAQSVLFVGSANRVGYDNTQFNPQEDPDKAAVPGPLPLVGVAAAFGYSRKLKRPIKSTVPFENLSF